jgi:hypothetical protein
MDEKQAERRRHRNEPLFWLLPVLEADSTRHRLGEHLKEAMERSLPKADKYDPAEVIFHQRSALEEARRIRKNMDDLIEMLERPVQLREQESV